jgi:hypothetical protein
MRVLNIRQERIPKKVNKAGNWDKNEKEGKRAFVGFAGPR